MEEIKNVGLDHSNSLEPCFPGLGKLTVQADWFDGMLIAGVILSGGDIPSSIRISGVFHSIRPLLFKTTGAGTVRTRLSIFKILVKSCVPDQIKTIVRIMWRALFRDPQHQGESIK